MDVSKCRADSCRLIVQACVWHQACSVLWCTLSIRRRETEETVILSVASWRIKTLIDGAVLRMLRLFSNMKDKLCCKPFN